MSAGIRGTRRETFLVICRANAARSPLVAGLLRARLDKLGRADLLVDSAGLDATAGLPATDEAIQVARGLGVDLAWHKSVSLTETMLSNAALVVTMTEAQRSTVERMTRRAVAYTFTLPELVRLLEASPDGPVANWSEMARRAHRARPLAAPSPAPEDLADPVGQPTRHYQALADRLAALSDKVVSHVLTHSTLRTV